MSFGWLYRRICDTDLGEKVYNAYLTAVARWGRWYVFPIGENPNEASSGRRCFTHRGAERMCFEFTVAERDAVEPIEMDRWETRDSIMVIHSYPVEATWVVGLWEDRSKPEFSESSRMLQNDITRDLLFGTA